MILNFSLSLLKILSSKITANITISTSWRLNILYSCSPSLLLSPSLSTSTRTHQRSASTEPQPASTSKVGSSQISLSFTSTEEGFVQVVGSTKHLKVAIRGLWVNLGVVPTIPRKKTWTPLVTFLQIRPSTLSIIGTRSISPTVMALSTKGPAYNPLNTKTGAYISEGPTTLSPISTTSTKNTIFSRQAKSS